ncbi:MAG TPA: PEP/pyruvate-binding domain-containing protein, partial [Thermoplasmata archaeon]|nr:PEP/pyruvate-binding domain-containing protein [Thermoplasmata archaeon]
MPKLVALSEVSDADIALVGGKAGKLGELVRLGLPVPPGLVVTTEAYQEFVEGAGLVPVIRESLAAIDPAKNETVEAASQRIRQAFESAEFPSGLKAEILQRVHRYEADHKVRFSAVRSSATAEDLEGASFAGLQETYLNVTGDAAILAAIRKCWGSLFTARVLVYRAKKGFDHRTIRLAVLVQKMVDSRVSGILFTKDPNTGENHMIVEAGFGLGEAIVGGEVTPDHYVVDGATQRIVQKQIAQQSFRLVRAEGGGNRREDLPAEEGGRQKLSDERVLRLASLAKVIESNYRRPMDIEWCADDHQLYVVQARPVTTIPSAPSAPVARNASPPAGAADNALVRGMGASPGIAAGRVRLLRTAAEMEGLKPGEILVTSMTTPDM